LYLCALGQKPGGGATGHTKRMGRRPNPKFDDYTQNSSEIQSKSKNQPQISTSAQDFEALTVIQVRLKDYYLIFFDLHLIYE
jgi:hypothetical protein